MLAVLLAGWLAACAPFAGSGTANRGALELSALSSATDVSFRGELFLPSDPEIEARLSWPGFREGTVLEWVWRDPQGRVFRRELRRAMTEEDRVRLPVADTEAARSLGRWQIAVSRPQGLVAVRDFHLVLSKNRWRVEHAEDVHQLTQALLNLCGEADYGFLASRYSFDMTSQAKGIILDCLDRNLKAACPLLAGYLHDNPQQETFLALLFQLKRRLVERLLTGGEDREAGFDILAQLRTQWDGPIFARLLESPVAAVRRAGVELVGPAGSPETVLILEKALADSDPGVRAAAFSILRRLGTPEAEEALADHLRSDPGRDATQSSGP